MAYFPFPMATVMKFYVFSVPDTTQIYFLHNFFAFFSFYCCLQSLASSASKDPHTNLQQSSQQQLPLISWCHIHTVAYSYEYACRFPFSKQSNNHQFQEGRHKYQKGPYLAHCKTCKLPLLINAIFQPTTTRNIQARLSFPC